MISCPAQVDAENGWLFRQQGNVLMALADQIGNCIVRRPAVVSINIEKLIFIRTHGCTGIWDIVCFQKLQHGGNIGIGVQYDKAIHLMFVVHLNEPVC